MISSAIKKISYGLKNEFRLAKVNGPLVVELLRVDCKYQSDETPVYARKNEDEKDLFERKDDEPSKAG